MSSDAELEKAVRELLSSQRLGTLATAANDQPYCSLVAFTPSDDLASILIATLRHTAKYRNMLERPLVSLLVDDRCGAAADFSRGSAVTCIGRAAAVPAGELEAARHRHFERHAGLRQQLDSPDCALVRIDISRYIMVRGVLRTDELTMP
jgi:nitroimidazol reductase NimA-like FMN-containing flavoprotein (pyridoxamine 5'-phosphate oxidase superfamily)